MKFLSLALLLGALLTVGCKKEGGSGSSSTAPSNEDEKVFYTVGSMFGSRLANLSLSEGEINSLVQGVRDAANGSKPAVDVAKYQPQVQKVFRERMQKNSEKLKQSGQKFLEDFVKSGAKKTESGIAYKVLKEGTGKTPKADDLVEVHYHGTLTDGKVFDSSVDRGTKVTFPLNRVIKGWTEGLQLIKEGGKIKLVIPANLAYGDAGAPPKVPGGATLVFEVELFEIKKKDAPAPAPAPKKK
ncbi:MAG: peptidylprolyl isomerase [Halobacteriovorax sp.]|nr:peptidylprolyl isomerase [Halobacteriovorax sp.]|tara:strand:- start:44021 stop:44746 length:726 start_codon:yes stop_codon:yes gene_type:complete